MATQLSEDAYSGSSVGPPSLVFAQLTDHPSVLSSLQASIRDGKTWAAHQPGSCLLPPASGFWQDTRKVSPRLFSTLPALIIYAYYGLFFAFTFTPKMTKSLFQLVCKQELNTH
jgi:hypothetical protein